MEFSVLLPIYQKENYRYFDLALESINNQTMRASEVVIVHDGPLNNSLYACIDKWKDNLPIVEVKLEKNVGLGLALNAGLKYCNHELVIRCDSDDINHIDRFKNQITYLVENQGVAVLSGYVEEFNNYIGDMARLKRVPVGVCDIGKTIIKRNPINHMAVAFRKSKIEEVGGYKELRFMEDYYLWVRVFNHKCLLENLPITLVYARVGNGMLNRRKGIIYVASEIKMLKIMCSLKMASFIYLFFVYFLRVVIRILPGFFLGKVYKRIRQ